MRPGKFLRITTFLSAFGALFFLNTGCSGSDQDQEEMEVSQEAEDATAEEEAVEEEVEELAEDEPMEDVVEEVAPMPSMGGSSADRVVRYVRDSGATAFAQAGDGASVGVFPQGTRLMVVVEGDWAKISNEIYVKVEELSAQPVPRAKSNAVWGKPAH